MIVLLILTLVLCQTFVDPVDWFARFEGDR